MSIEQLRNRWPIVGHDAAVHFLQKLVSTGPRHAYLITGTRQVGKSTLAQTFAQALLCTGTEQPCGGCRGCRLLLQGNHADFRLIQPVDKDGTVDRIGGMLRVEQANEIIHDVALRPMEGRYKIFIIQDIHTANDSFANKLLKTLEEPPAHAIFLLTAVERSRLLPTIVSRCQIVELRPLAPTTIEQALCQQLQAEPAQAELLSRLAQGRFGWAVQQLAEPNRAQERLSRLQMLWSLLDAKPVERLSTAEKLASSTGSMQLFELLETWTTWWRDILLVQANCTDACHNLDQRVELERQATLLIPQSVREYLHTIARIESYLHHTINTRLALEVLLLQLPDAHQQRV